MNLVFAQSETFFQYVYIATLGFIAIIALVAMISPALFRRIEGFMNHSIDTSGLEKLMDRPVDIDRFLSRHVRLLGAGAFSVALILAIKML